MGLGPMGRDRGRFRSSPYGDGPYPNRRNRYIIEEDDFGPPLRRIGRRIEERLFMRGMPYSVTGVDIEMFFDPLRCVEIRLGYSPDGRPSGDALVTFESVTECDRALSRSGRMMGNRYVELFPASDMPASARRIEFRPVSSSNSLLKLPNFLTKGNPSSGYGRERNRLLPPNRNSRGSGLNRNSLPSHRHGLPVSENRGSPLRRDRPSPAPVPRPVPLSQINASRQSSGIGDGYNYGNFNSSQHQQSLPYSSPQHLYGSQTSSSFQNPGAYSPHRSYGQNTSNYNSSSSYGSPNTFSNNPSYSQPAYSTNAYNSQTYSSQNSYSSQPYYSQSSAYGQPNSYNHSSNYSEPSYHQVPYGSGELSKSVW